MPFRAFPPLADPKWGRLLAPATRLPTPNRATTQSGCHWPPPSLITSLPDPYSPSFGQAVGLIASDPDHAQLPLLATPVIPLRQTNDPDSQDMAVAGMRAIQLVHCSSDATQAQIRKLAGPSFPSLRSGCYLSMAD